MSQTLWNSAAAHQVGRHLSHEGAQPPAQAVIADTSRGSESTEAPPSVALLMAMNSSNGMVAAMASYTQPHSASEALGWVQLETNTSRNSGV